MDRESKKDEITIFYFLPPDNLIIAIIRFYANLNYWIFLFKKLVKKLLIRKKISEYIIKPQ
ncbi:33928_t:CDS:2 [Gigaspora margarita]|uniref:33928_t:CDS:1 n=1 Tax=Gigaspora margarita TaxID=4874 RepID=A0ABN7UB25_GIGMA|nr:33928_t:CDS:2 [Gigaspora margarita]